MQELNNQLAHGLAGFQPHEPSLPTPRRTPPSVKSKVVAKVDRAPVNRQAALIVARVRDWTAQPPPMPAAELPTPERQEIKRLTADLKTERNDHALTRDALGQMRQELAALKHEGQKLRAELAQLKLSLREKDDTIRQLEHIKL